MISKSTKQSMCIKFCDKIRKTAIENYQLLQIAFSDATMS